MSKENPEILLQAVVTFIVAVFLIGFILLVVRLIQRGNRLQEEEIKRFKVIHEKKLLETQIETQEEILKNVSMEIHDNVSQILLLANVNLSLFQFAETPEQSFSLIAESKRLISSAMEDLSELSRNIHSDRISEIGIDEAIRNELDWLSKKGAIKTNFFDDTDGKTITLPNETQLVLFRMHQEAIKNILKHAEAKTVSYLFESVPGGITLTIEDDGKGFEPETVKNGIGLRSLHSRAELIKGSIQIKSSVAEGTHICIFIPFAE